MKVDKMVNHQLMISITARKPALLSTSLHNTKIHRGAQMLTNFIWVTG